MKKTALIITLTLFSIAVKAQEVKWDYSAKKTGNGIYELHFTASVPNPWHIYSHYLQVGGPVATTFKFDIPAVQLTDSIKEAGKLVEKFDPAFGIAIRYYENRVDFIQSVRTGVGATAISGTVTYMICTEDHCMPPVDMPFHIVLNP